MNKNHASDKKIFDAIFSVRDQTSKSLVIMDDITRMIFVDTGSGISVDPHRVEAGMSLIVRGEMMDYDSGERLSDSAKTSVVQVFDDDSFTWDVFIFEGDDAVYASIGLERIKELVMPMKEDPELER